MAIRLTSASAQNIGRTANVPSLTAFTLCGWTSRVSNANYGALIALENPGASAYLTLQMESTSTSLTCYMNGGGSFGCGSKALNTPYFFALVCSGTAAGGVKVYFRAASAAVLESYDSTSAGSITSFTPNSIKVGTDQFGENYDGNIWGVKCWDRALSAAEILIESYYRRPKFPSSLNFHWPLDNASNLSSIDEGGNARPPTLAGTPTAADGQYGLWAPRRRIFVPVAAAGGSVALTGSSLTSAQGTLAPATDKAVTGQALTSAQGTAAPALSVALTGSSATVTAGTLVPSVSIALTGQVLATAQGSVSAGGDLTLSLTGQALTLSAGTLAPAISRALAGTALTGSAGTVIPATSKALAGSSATAAQGALAPALTAALSGNLLTVGQGAVSAPGNVTLTLTGQSLTATQGAFTPSLARAIAGSAATSSAGSVIASPSPALSGAGLTASVGTLGVGRTVSLSGSLASMTQGTVFSASGGIVAEVRISFTSESEQTTFVASTDQSLFTARQVLH